MHLVGADDVRAEEKIRGGTVEITYVDEATLLPLGFWEMLLIRLCTSYSRLRATTALNDPFVGTLAWKTVKSSFFIGTVDKIIRPAEQEVLAERAHGVVEEAHVDHLSMLEAPSNVTALIEKAAA